MKQCCSTLRMDSSVCWLFRGRLGCTTFIVFQFSSVSALTCAPPAMAVDLQAALPWVQFDFYLGSDLCACSTLADSITASRVQQNLLLSLSTCHEDPRTAPARIFTCCWQVRLD